RASDTVTGGELLAHHAGEIAEPFEMLFSDRRDDRDVRLDDRTEARDLTGLVRAHLDDGDVGVVGEREEREGDADQVVEIPVCRVRLERAAKGRLEKLFRARLPIRADDADHRVAAPPHTPPMAR